MTSPEKLLAELQVATRLAGTTTDAQTARDLRRYVRELEDQMRHRTSTTFTVSI
ncbi:hypothetical protein J2Y58_003376 [Sphingomonas sp. BE138]|uniref:hypothetical protein n=1 Tax=Sphingomonas sp. BE138 TaxID=2817845 RepID=UPI0028673201|nr:hypothetical protein [Sphingomonas sp. BE138]MDR6789996.1 hypothetical protein [Sphingomonas sp. BE138]